ncbi:MAG TPA: LCP family protein [Actinomycetes bacterium]|nr:LCP family protein [Actinomycetes bacterium]
MAGGTQLVTGAPAGPERERRMLEQHARQFRRVVVFAVMSLVVPGSAHLLAGRIRAGTLILRCYLVLLGLVVALAVVGLRDRAMVLSLAVRPLPLAVLQYAALAVGLAWVLVVVSGALLAQPQRLEVGQRRAVAAIVLVLCLAVVLPSVTTARYAAAQRDLITDVFRDTAVGDLPDRLNILLLGGDSGPDRIGVRTDSITVASVDTRSGDTVMFSVPRNLEDVPFPADSPLQARFPDGFDCDGCLLNAVYTYAETNRRQLFPGVPDPGPLAVKQAVSAVLGIPVHYYVLVNLEGFRGIIDALGGITIRVERSLPIGDNGHRLPAGLQYLNGYHALWYARSRADSDDYQRMSRQRCVMGALLHQADPMRVLRNYQKLAKSTKHLVATDIPRGALPELVDVALRVKDAKITNVQFVPPFVSTGNPDYNKIRARVAASLDPAGPAQPDGTGAGSGSGGTSSGAGSGSGGTGQDGGTGSGPSGSGGASGEPGASPPGDPVSLATVCRYS